MKLNILRNREIYYKNAKFREVGYFNANQVAALE
jgi:hypothetical protein